MPSVKIARTERLEARVSSETKELIAQAAALEGRSLTDFVVDAAAESARRVIAANAAIELTARDQTAFAQSLLDPPQANARLVLAARAYKAMVESDDD